MPYTVGDICRLIAKRKASTDDAPGISKNIFEGIDEEKVTSVSQGIWQATAESSASKQSKKGKRKPSKSSDSGYIPFRQSTEDGECSRRKSKPEGTKERPVDSPSRLSRTIFVGHIPPTTSKKALYHHFKPYGKIESIRLRCAIPPKLSVPKKVAVIKNTFHPELSSISAFVVFSSESEAQAALSLNATVWNGQHIRVDIANKSKSHDHKRSVFIGNIPCNVDDEDIWQFFSDCGKVQGVRIVRDRWTGVGKGFGYVLFENPESVALALQKQGLEFQGRQIRISRSLAKQTKDRFEERMSKKSSVRQIKKDNIPNASKGTFGSKGKKKKNLKKSLKKRRQEKKKKTVAEILISSEKKLKT